jgi:outer membrane protein TolC
MISTDSGAALRHTILAQDRAEAAERLAAHALAEAEERLDDGATTDAEVEALRLRYAEALAAAEAAQERRREAEAATDLNVACRVYASLHGRR